MNGFHCITLSCLLTLSVVSNATMLDTGNLYRYNKEVAGVAQQGLHYLQFRLTEYKRLSNPKPLAVIFDVDGTALSCDQHSALPYTRTLYIFAKNNGVSVFFISQRHERARDITEKNLIAAGYTGWAGLVMQPNDNPPSSSTSYNIAARKKIVDLGYDIVFTISTHQSNLAGGFSDMTFKLPDLSQSLTEVS